jgi:hypothetical protein
MALQGQHWHETDIAGSVSNVLCWDYNGSGISEPSGQLWTQADVGRKRMDVHAPNTSTGQYCSLLNKLS